MATFLDLASLEGFTDIFVFLFVLVIFYVLFSAAKDLISKPLAWILAASVAFLIILTPLANQMVSNTLPFFGVFMVAAIAAIAARGLFAGGEDQGPMELRSLFATIVFLIILGGIGITIRENVTVPGDNETTTDFDRDYSEIEDTLLSPTLMGAILMFGVAIAAVALLARET